MLILLSGRTSTNNYTDVNNENENSSRCSGGTSMWFSSFRSRSLQQRWHINVDWWSRFCRRG
ncbi:hypothetical protein THOB06_40184 [Vibrio rotiferianus]|nr:hypothetical protein THOG10_40185 [Vibrio rotiferianus]CAH1589140.1 hypothetical protein THOB06_40184 [Vibrio rotiferianus]